MVHRNYHNGLKTTLLLGGMWALLVCIGALVARGTGQAIWILLFAGIGLAQTAYLVLELCVAGAALNECVPGLRTRTARALRYRA